MSRTLRLGSRVGRKCAAKDVGGPQRTATDERTLGREEETRHVIAANYSGPVVVADDLDCFQASLTVPYEYFDSKAAVGHKRRFGAMNWLPKSRQSRRI
jgi:hypothetical protein